MADPIARALAVLERQFGDGVAVRLGSSDQWSRLTAGLSTRSLMIDFAIGRPGIPLGRITEIVGLEASSKSTLMAHIMAEAQAQGGAAVMIDSEHATDVARLQRLGVDTRRAILLQPSTLEESFDMLEEAMLSLVKAKVRPLVLGYDTVAGMQSKAEEADAYESSHMGVHARVMSQSLRKLVPLIARHQVALVFVNQLKEQLGLYVPPGGPKKYRSIGGHAIEYHASVRLEVKQKEIERVGKGDDAIATGVWVQVKVVKNKIAPPYRTATCFVDFKTGYSRVRDLLRAAIRTGVVTRTPNGRLALEGRGFALAQWKATAQRVGVKRLRRMVLEAAVKQGILKPWDPP